MGPGDEGVHIAERKLPRFGNDSVVPAKGRDSARLGHGQFVGTVPGGFDLGLRSMDTYAESVGQF
jgi:hypothetical protein